MAHSGQKRAGAYRARLSDTSIAHHLIFFLHVVIYKNFAEARAPGRVCLQGFKRCRKSFKAAHEHRARLLRHCYNPHSIILCLHCLYSLSLGYF